MAGPHNKLPAHIIQHIADFNHLISNRKEDETPIFDCGVPLINALMDTCGSLKAIEGAMKASCGKNAYDDRILYNLILYTLAVEHEGLDRLLALMAEDDAKKKPVIISDDHRKKMARLHVGALSEKLPKDRSPKLWDKSYNLQHNPEHFLMFNLRQAEHQLADIFLHNYESLPKILNSLQGIPEKSRNTLQELLMNNVAKAPLQLDDEIRRLIVADQDPTIEIGKRIKHLFETIKSDPNANHHWQIDDCADLIKSHDKDLAEFLTESINLNLMCHKTDRFVVTALDPFLNTMHLITSMSAFGYNAKDSFRAMYMALTQSKDEAVFKKILSDLPIQSLTGYFDSRIFFLDVWRISTLLVQNPDELLKANLASDSLLALHLLTGDNRFKEKLQEPHHVESLLGHDLGL
jgi:hypothetical protein